MWLSNKYTLRILCTLGMLCLFSSYLKPMEGEGEHESEEHTETPVSGGSQEDNQPPPGQPGDTGEGQEPVKTPTETGTGTSSSIAKLPTESGSEAPPSSISINTGTTDEEAAAKQDAQEIMSGFKESLPDVLNSLGGFIPEAQKNAVSNLLTTAESFLEPFDEYGIQTYTDAYESYLKLLFELIRPQDYESELASGQITVQELFDDAYKNLQDIAETKLSAAQATDIQTLINDVTARAKAAQIKLTPLESVSSIREDLTTIGTGQSSPLLQREKTLLTSLLDTADQASSTNAFLSGRLINVAETYTNLLKEMENTQNPDKQEIQTLLIEVYSDLKELASNRLNSSLGQTVSGLSETLNSRVRSQGVNLAPSNESIITMSVQLLDSKRVFDSLLEKPTITAADKNRAVSEFNDIAAKLDAYGSVVTDPLYTATIKEYRDEFEKSKTALQQKYNLVLMEPKDIQTAKTAAANLEESVAHNKAALIDELKDVLASKRNVLQRGVDSVLDTISSIRVKISEAIQQFFQQNISEGSSIFESIMSSLGSLKNTVSEVVSDATIPENIQETVTGLLYETAAATLSAVSAVKGGIDLVTNPFINNFYTQATTYATDAQTNMNKFRTQRK